MTNTYYIQSAGQTHGPCTLSEIREMTYSGQIPPQTSHYRAQSSDPWKPLRELLDPPAPLPVDNPETPTIDPRKARFYENYAKYLRSQKLSSLATRAADPDPDPDCSKLERAAITIGALAIGALSGPAGLAYSITSLQSLPDQARAGIEAAFAPMARHTPIVLFRVMFGFVYVTVAIEADHLSDDQLLAISREFDNCLLQARRHTLHRRVLFVIKQQTGTIMGTFSCIFFDPEKAANFKANLQKQCNTRHFMKKVSIRAQAIDIQQKTVHTHSWLPVLYARQDRKMAATIFPAS